MQNKVLLRRQFYSLVIGRDAAVDLAKQTKDQNTLMHLYSSWFGALQAKTAKDETRDRKGELSYFIHRLL
jgi:hypothetical protein